MTTLRTIARLVLALVDLARHPDVMGRAEASVRAADAWPVRR